MIEHFISNMPKVELHLHLEGAIPLDALWQLVEKYKGQAELRSISELEKKFKYVDFPGFIQTWFWKNKFLKEYEDFTFIAAEVAKDLAAQNIQYVEAFYSPGDFARHGLELNELTASIRKGLDVHKDKITINIIPDLVRDFGPEKGDTWLSQIIEVRDMGIIGIGLGGPELEFPPKPYKDIYERARKNGFKTTAHAGEAAGPGYIWDAVKELKVDRIGHGTRAIEDADLMEYLADAQIPIEMCPISNLRTAVVGSMKEHPIKNFFDKGLLVSVNTDDPKMFNNSLTMEYMELIKTFGWGKKEIIKLAENTIKSCWCNDPMKAELKNNLSKYCSSNAI